MVQLFARGDAAAPEMLYPNYARQQATANQEGKTAINGLLPGVCRLIAYQPGALRADDSNFWQKLMSGQRVQVTPNQQAVIEIPAEALR